MCLCFLAFYSFEELAYVFSILQFAATFLRHSPILILNCRLFCLNFQAFCLICLELCHHWLVRPLQVSSPSDHLWQPYHVGHHQVGLLIPVRGRWKVPDPLVAAEKRLFDIYTLCVCIAFCVGLEWSSLHRSYCKGPKPTWSCLTFTNHSNKGPWKSRQTVPFCSKTALTSLIFV